MEYSDCQLPIANFPIANCRFPIADFRIAIGNWKSAIGNILALVE